MDQSRSRYRLRELIIEDKDAVTFPRKLTEASFSMIFWAIWGALWIPLISLIAWLLGFRLLSNSMWESKDYSFQITIALCAILFLLLIFNWSIYSRFNQRTSPLHPHMAYYHAGITQTNQFFEFDNQDAEQLMESEMIRFGFQETREMPSFVLMVDGKKIIKKHRKFAEND